MALNLSTLTNPATSGTVLAEALTTADFLDPVPILKNLARGSQKGGDAKQTTGLNQPRALPLIKNPSGNLGGYLYIPNVSGNYATGPSVTIGSNQTWEGEVDMVITQYGNYVAPLGGGLWSSGFGFIIRSDGFYRVFSKGASTAYANNPIIPLGSPTNIKYGFNGTLLYVDINGQRAVDSGGGQFGSITHPLQLNQQANIGNQGNYAIQKAKLTVNSAVVFDCDFNGSTSIRHGDTKFQASVGGPVTINKSGNDPATIIKKSVLRFDGANSGLHGLFANNINGGYMFAAFSVLGDGGGDAFGRVFSIADNAGVDAFGGGFIFSIRDNLTDNVGSYFNSFFNTHNDLFDDSNGDILHEVKSLSGQNHSKINNANALNDSRDTSTVNSDRFNVGAWSNSINNNAALDLEYLALFPASITDAEADSVRNYINNRNNVFDLKDGFGYYFYNAQAAPVGAITTGSASWNGRIVGSDNGDSDKLATQGTTNDAPVGDGFVVTFADNTDHLDIPSTTQAGWQVVGTSLGTFAYRVNANAVTELNLLGNAGLIRLIGDLYGIILLPESATGKDIEEARKLLIDRGASDAAGGSSFYGAWYERRDMVTFKNSSFPDTTNFAYSWENCVNLSNLETLHAPSGTSFVGAWRGTSALTSFPSGAKLGTAAANVDFSFAWNSSGLTAFNTPLPTANSVYYAWQNCTSLTSFSSELPLVTDVRLAWHTCSSLSEFRTTDIKNGTNFTSAWQNCSALQSFPAGAKLGTSANNVNFDSAWQSSGLTSFPALDLSNGNIFASAFKLSPLTSFPEDILLGTNSTAVRFDGCWMNCSGLTSFPNIDLSEGRTFNAAWWYNTSLVNFPALFTNWSPSTVTSSVFHGTWTGCSSLSSTSVENILTSIDSSGVFGTYTGLVAGTSLPDAGIDIDYNVATGSLSAATNAAVTSLKAKGWSIIVNNVTL